MQCPKCGSGVPDGSTQCHICFAPLAADTPQGPTGLQAPALRQPVSDEIEPGIPGITRPAGVPSQPLGGESDARPNYLSPAVEPTPNYMAPGTGGAPQMGGGAVRVSLTGEVIEVPGAGPAQPMGYAPPGPAQPMGPVPIRPGQPMPPQPIAQRPGVPPPTRPAPTSYTRPGPYQAARSGSGGGGKAILVVVLLLLILGGAGAGGWWWYNNRTNPKDQALAAYKAVAATDWRALYPLVALSEADRAKYPDAESFARQVQSEADKQANASLGVKILHSLTDIAVGEPISTGDRVDVPTSAKLSIGGISVNLRGTAHMVKEAGIWKLDATQGGSAAAKLGADLLGKPEGMPAGIGLGLGAGAQSGSAGGGRRPGRRNR